MKLIGEAVRVPAPLLEDGTVAALGPLSEAAMTRAKLSAKNQGHDAKEVEVEIKRLDIQVKPHPSTLKHVWFVTGKDKYGEFSIEYPTRKEAREQIVLEKDQDHFTTLERLDPITHRVYQLVKEEKVS